MIANGTVSSSIQRDKLPCPFPPLTGFLMKYLRLKQVSHLFLVLTMSIVGCSQEHAETSSDARSGDALGTESTANDSEDQAGFYTVGHYDKTGDPDADLAATIKRAGSEEKRILLQVGGDWCGWCARISDYMQTNEKVRSLLDQSFVVMKVTYPGDNAEEFLAQYPECNAYPHFFVLEKDGTFLYSQGTGELEQAESYDEKIFTDFLTAWIP
jgi:thioredoxin-related protein